MLAERNIHKRNQPTLGKNLKSPLTKKELSFSEGKYFIPLVLFVLCLLLYGNTLFNQYAGDDGIYTYQNEFIRKGFSAFKDIFDKGSLYGVLKDGGNPQYRPLPLLSFMAEIAVFGFNPHISHFFNILLFAFTVVLLYFFLQKILKNYNPAIAFAAALLFAFHPIHTEVVANIKSRDEMMGLFFGLLSFYCLLLYREQGKNKYYFFSLAAFCAAIFCKENCLTFIAIIPLLLYFFTTTTIKEIALKTIPYIGLVGFYLFIRSLVIHNITFTSEIPVIVNILSAAHNTAERTATSFVLLGKYISMNIIPYPLSDDYSYNQIPVYSWASINPILSLLATMALLGIIFWGLKKKSIFSFLIALFFITLLLSSNLIIKIACTFGERFLFVPSLSFCVAVPILLAMVLKIGLPPLSGTKRIYFFAPIINLLIIYAVIVIPRNREWKNNYTLSLARVNAAPNCAEGHYYFAKLLMDSAGHIDAHADKATLYSLSTHEFKRAIEIYSAFSDWDYNLGVCYYNQGDIDSAVLAYRKALQIDSGFALAAYNLGVIYFTKARYDTAISFFKISYRDDSTDLDPLMNLAVAYQSKKDFTPALYYATLVLKKDTNSLSARSNLSAIYNDIGIQFVDHKEFDKAMEQFSLALKYDSNSANAIGDMGVVHQEKGEVEKARICYLKALALNPAIPGFAKNLQILNSGKKE